MANTLLTSNIVTREAGMILKNSLSLGARCARKYENYWKDRGNKPGNSIDVRIPPRFLATHAEALNNSDNAVTEAKRTVSLLYAHVGLQLGRRELTTDLNSFSENVLQPAVAALANFIDLDLAEQYKEVFNLVGTIGAGSPTALLTYLQAGSKLVEEGVPKVRGQNWPIFINAVMNESIVDALKGLFESSPQLRQQYEQGSMRGRMAAGFEWFDDQNMFLHTCGTRLNDASQLVNGAGQTGTSLVVSVAGASKTYLKGDVFTIANVNAVNPQSRQSNKRLRQFRVTEDATSTAGGAVTLSIYPALVASGKDQTVDALAVDTAAITFNGAASATGHQGLAMHPQGFSLTFVDQEQPEEGVWGGVFSDPNWNVSLRLLRQYTIGDNQVPARLDALYAPFCQRPELVCRVTN